MLVEQQAELVRELQSDILKVVKDPNGNHVIQQVIALVPRQHIDFIMDCFRGRVSELASHTYGCRVIQRALEHGTEADRAAIMKELHGCVQMLVTDQYGNYVVQHVLEKGKPEDRSRIIDLVTSQVMTLSKHKFASNVVEACIRNGTLEERRKLRDVIAASGEEPNSPLFHLMKDQFGNYVIRKSWFLLQPHVLCIADTPRRNAGRRVPGPGPGDADGEVEAARDTPEAGRCHGAADQRHRAPRVCGLCAAEHSRERDAGVDGPDVAGLAGRRQLGRPDAQLNRRLGQPPEQSVDESAVHHHHHHHHYYYYYYFEFGFGRRCGKGLSKENKRGERHTHTHTCVLRRVCLYI